MKGVISRWLALGAIFTVAWSLQQSQKVTTRSVRSSIAMDIVKGDLAGKGIKLQTNPFNEKYPLRNDLMIRAAKVLI